VLVTAGAEASEASSNTTIFALLFDSVLITDKRLDHPFILPSGLPRERQEETDEGSGDGMCVCVCTASLARFPFFSSVDFFVHAVVLSLIFSHFFFLLLLCVCVSAFRLYGDGEGK
jgi:hypothetical protein